MTTGTTVRSAPSRKELEFSEFKALDEAQGIFEGYLACFGNVDSYKDVIDHGAFTKTLSEAELSRERKSAPYLFPLLWQHNPTEPIGGFLEMREDAKGLYVKGQIDLDIEQGRRAFSGMIKGYLRGLSIGYDTIKEQFKDGLRRLKEIRLWEGSTVTFAANPLTYVDGVKSEERQETDEYDEAEADYEYKTVCGNTSGPIGPRDESWSGGAAKKWIWSQALNADGSVKPGVAKKYFMRCDGDPKIKGSYGYPFWTNGHISVGGVKAVAGALSGARGASAGSDTGGMKKKVERLYSRINSKYPNDPKLTAPWKPKKARSFDDVTDDRSRSKAMSDLYDHTSNLISAITEIMYDDSETDKSAAIAESHIQFGNALQDWCDECEESFAPDDDTNDSSVVYDNDYPGFMNASYLAVALKHATLSAEVALKAGRSISAANRAVLKDAHSAISGALESIKPLFAEEEERADNAEPDEESNMLSNTTGEEEGSVVDDSVSDYSTRRPKSASKATSIGGLAVGSAETHEVTTLTHSHPHVTADNLGVHEHSHVHTNDNEHGIHHNSAQQNAAETDYEIKDDERLLELIKQIRQGAAAST